MKPVARRRIRIGLTAACGAVVAVFVASCAWGLFVHWENASYVAVDVSVVRGAIHATYSDRGGIAASIGHPPMPGWKITPDRAFGPPPVEWTPAWNFGQGGMFPSWFVRVPLWVPFLLLGASCGWMWWRRMHEPANACWKCGYDMNGTPGGICPECGTPARDPERPRRLNLWRLRRTFFRPVAGGVVLAVLLVAASSYFYVLVRVWTFGTGESLLVGLSGRTLCVEQLDLRPMMWTLPTFSNPNGTLVPVPFSTAPASSLLQVGWLGQGVHWEPAWFPVFATRSSGWIVAIPWWNLAVAGVVFLVGLHMLQSRRFCRHCGYDLRGLPRDICPECGRAFRRRVGSAGP